MNEDDIQSSSTGIQSPTHLGRLLMEERRVSEALCSAVVSAIANGWSKASIERIEEVIRKW